ncbi:mechanosensitive ion channel family protein [Carboxylicivirga marina]|uniref:Mechanosensitive ion channel n=1 Tax=Carboxylicivirga marina TaxID=2800988 RepID=A0ABS1HK53_9BACT|nr:mechanosensitive ion channel domain-containing protein [Carboxylicivirga marina]MBK3517985.1 mechanosensitive ion channel [Carboxylicivirga marina]
MDISELNKISQILQEYLNSVGIDQGYTKYLLATFWIIITVLIAWLSNRITKKYIARVIEKIIRKTKSKYDDILLERQVFKRLANLVPAIIIYSMLGIIFEAFADSDIVGHLQKITSSVIVFILLLSFIALLGVVNDIYNTFSYAKERPIKGLIQIIQIAVSALAAIVIISILFDIDITKILTGLGATAAVLLLVFKDTILGFVASIQLSANKMVTTGDWITMPTYKTDGTVIDISLNTVKVQNWDQTITTIPTYKMVEDSFINWKGMEQSGGRRIKRSVNIDMRTVKFCSADMIERFKKIRLLKDYISQKEDELLNHNTTIEGQSVSESLANGRRLTNLGVFRKYLNEYLSEHPMTLNNMTFMVRQLQSTEKGQPIEIYAFSKDQEWKNYESIQADIFDHILAVVNEFDLKIYQLPSGNDFNSLNYGNHSL